MSEASGHRRVGGAERLEHGGRRRRDDRRRQHREHADDVDHGAEDHRGRVGVGLHDLPRLALLPVGVGQRPAAAQLVGRLPQLLGGHQLGVGGHHLGEVGGELRLAFAGLSAGGDHRPVVLGGQREAAVHEVAERVGQVLVDRDGELLPREARVARLGRVGEQEPAPVVGGVDVERLVHEHATALARGELAAVVREPVEALDLVGLRPRLARPDERDRERHRVERHVVLGHELRVLDVVGVVPPAPPVAARRRRRPTRRWPRGTRSGRRTTRTRPCPRSPGRSTTGTPQSRSRVMPRSCSPSSSHLRAIDSVSAGQIVGVRLHPRRAPRRPASTGGGRGAWSRAPRGRCCRRGPSGARAGRWDRAPGCSSRTGRRGRSVVAAVRAGADDVAVGEEAPVDRRVHLLGDALLEVALAVEPGGEVLGELVVLRRRAAPEVVPAQPEPLADRPSAPRAAPGSTPPPAAPPPWRPAPPGCRARRWRR